MHGRGSFDMKGGVAAVMAGAAAVAGSRPARRRHRGAACATRSTSRSAPSAWLPRSGPTRRSSPSPPSSRCASPTRGSSGSTSRPPVSPPTGRAPTSASTRSPRWARCSSASRSSAPGSRGSRPHPLLGTGSVHASLIEGGQELSSYPERCLLRIERRTVPGETLADVEAQIVEIAAGADVRSTFERAPFEVASDAPIVDAVRRHAVTVLGREPATSATPPGWTPPSSRPPASRPSCSARRGPGRTPSRSGSTSSSVERCAQVLEAVAREWCA